MRTAQESAQKFVERAGNASGEYKRGSETTSRDQAARAIGAKTLYQNALTASFSRDAFAKGLQKSGKQGWLDGVIKKGADRYAPGVAVSAGKYATNSGRFDQARQAADNLPRGLKGSDINLNRVKAVVAALRAVKLA